MVKSKINVDADKRFHLRITQWSYPICDSWTSTSIRHWLLASQPTSKEYCTVCLWEIFNIILYFPVDCLFRVKTITLETANVTNCHVIATDILFLSSNHRSVQFLYLAASRVTLTLIWVRGIPPTPSPLVLSGSDFTRRWLCDNLLLYFEVLTIYLSKKKISWVPATETFSFK